MSEWEKLLGGYATGTLSSEERARLMQAALSDQDLFDLLMDEDALRETLDDPATRRGILRALEPTPAVVTTTAKIVPWWRQPWPWAGLGAVAAAVALILILRPVNAPQPVQTARNGPVNSQPAPASAAAVAPPVLPLPSVIKTPQRLDLTEPQAPAKPSNGPTSASRGALQMPKLVSEPTIVSGALSATTDAAGVSGGVPSERLTPRAYAGSVVAPQNNYVAAAAPTAPPPPPAPAIAREKKELSSSIGALEMSKQSRDEARAVADSAPSLESTVEPILVVTLSYQSKDGVWHAVPFESSVPAKRPLRLQVTSASTGILAMEPPLAQPKAIIAGTPISVDLRGQRAGTLALRLNFISSPGDVLSEVTTPLRKGKKSDRADFKPALRPSYTREIRLNIQ